MKTSFQFILALTALTAAVGSCAAAEGSQPRERVEIDRVGKDSAYAARVEHHVNIKTFLNSPARQRPELDSVLVFLLETGYTIDDLSLTWLALSLPLFPPPPDPEALRAKSLDDEQIEFLRKRHELLHGATSGQRLRRIMRTTGIYDEDYVKALATIVPIPREARPGFDMKRLQAIDGEALLDDSDWMTDRYKAAAAVYQGERRRMNPLAPRPLPAFEGKALIPMSVKVLKTPASGIPKMRDLR